jgi:hypothetical protein
MIFIVTDKWGNNDIIFMIRITLFFGGKFHVVWNYILDLCCH